LLGLPPAEQALCDKMMKDDTSRIAWRTGRPIGASGGVPTPFICFELDATTPIVHAYPVSEDEARQINNGAPITTISDLRDWELP